MTYDQEPPFESRQGAYRQSWRQVNPREVLARIMTANPDWDEAMVKAECWNKVSAGWEFRPGPACDQALMYATYSYWFDNNYRSLLSGTRRRYRRPVPKRVLPVSSTAPQSQPQTQAQAEVRQSSMARAIADRVNIVLLDLMMPNGKRLRDNTREELDETIEWQKRIRDRLEPGQTPKEAGLSEQEVRDLI